MKPAKLKNSKLSNPFENRNPKDVWAEMKGKGRLMSDDEKQKELDNIKTMLRARKGNLTNPGLKTNL